jgi:hypothetical protein
MSRFIAHTHVIKQDETASGLSRVKIRRYTSCFGMLFSGGRNSLNHAFGEGHDDRQGDNDDLYQKVVFVPFNPRVFDSCKKVD